MAEVSYAYALEVWKSEEENARRLGSKKALVAGFPGAILALVGLTGDQGQTVVAAMGGASTVAWLSAFFFALALFSLVRSLARALGVRPAGAPLEPPASVALHPEDDESLAGLVASDQDDVRLEAAVRLFAAAGHLRASNQDLSEALTRALEWLFAGILFLVAAFVSYIFV